MPKDKDTVDAFNLSVQDMVKAIESAPHTAANSESFAPLTIEDLDETGLTQTAVNRIFNAADAITDTVSEVSKTLVTSANLLLAYANQQMELIKADDTPAEMVTSYSASVEAITTYVDRIMEIINISKKTADGAISIMKECITMMDDDESEAEDAASNETAVSAA